MANGKLERKDCTYQASWRCNCGLTKVIFEIVNHKKVTQRYLYLDGTSNLSGGLISQTTFCPGCGDRLPDPKAVLMVTEI